MALARLVLDSMDSSDAWTLSDVLDVARGAGEVVLLIVGLATIILAPVAA